MHHPTKERYHCCLDMERALARLGADSQGAAMFTDQKYVKKGLLDAADTIKKRLGSITIADQEHKNFIVAGVDRLIDETNSLSDEINNDLDIIADLLDIIALLLGLNELEDKPPRKVTIQ